MKRTVQSYDFDQKIKYPDLSRKYIKDGDLFACIETTGLSPERDAMISFTAARISGDHIEASVALAETKDEELAVIETALSEISECGRLILWNASGFDLKFLSTRASVYAIKVSYDSSEIHLPSGEAALFDLSASLRPLRRLLPDPTLSIYPLLERMGIEDDDLPDGRTVATLYKAYIGSGEEKYADPVIGHSLSKACGLISLMAMLESFSINMASVEVRQLGTDGERLLVRGGTDIFVPVSLCFTLPGIALTFTHDSFTASFDYFGGRIRVYYPDYSSYVRIKESGQLIPKELSKSLPKDSYEKVDKTSCYTLFALPKEPDAARHTLESYIKQLVLM